MTFTAAVFAEFLTAHFDYLLAVPDSRSQQLLSVLHEAHSDRFVQVTDEATAVCIASGVTVSSTSCVVIMESSGLRRAFEALGRLSSSHGIHPALIVTDRGQLGDWEWWASEHHPHARAAATALGARTAELTPAMSPPQISAIIAAAAAHYRAQQSPVILWCHPDLLQAQ